MDGSIDLTVVGGASPYTFYWSNSTATEDLSGLPEANYWVSIVDANNCQLLLNNLQVGSSCLASIVHQNYPALISNTYQVANFIKSNGIVNTNELVSFKAGEYIELTDSFEVIIGAEFEAKIDGCE